MKYYIISVGVTNGIPDMFIDEADSFEEMGAMLSTYHQRGLSVAAFLGEQIQLNKDVTHGLLRGTIKKFAEIDKDQFTSEFIDGAKEEANDA